jgi:hypothetical protein
MWVIHRSSTFILNCPFHCHVMTPGISTQTRVVHQTYSAFWCSIKDLLFFDVNELSMTVHVQATVLSKSSTFSNQLLAGLIIVRPLNSTMEPSLPHITFPNGFVMTFLGGKLSYFHLLRLLFTWQPLQLWIKVWIVVRIPFQYIIAFVVSSRWVCPGCCEWWWYHCVALSGAVLE